MHYTQNDKIRQATEGTIVVGVDVGNEKNYARAFKGNGIEITRKAFCFANTLEGFKSFDEMVTKLMVPLAEKKIVIGMEPTGHYWFNFADYCQGKQMTVVTVAPQHVKHSKELDNNTQRKDDRKDPGVRLILVENQTKKVLILLNLVLDIMGRRNGMKRMQLLLILLLSVLLYGCAAPPKTPESLSVTLLQDDTFTLAEGYAYQTVAKPGNEVRFVLRPEPGFVLTGTDCPNAVIAGGAGGSVILIVNNIQYPTRIRVLSEPDANFCTIIYDLNGGCTADGASTFSVRHALNGHMYPNTDPAIGATNPGCTLIGWNTERDGSGEHTGLGSRCRTDVCELTLYAQWLPWTDGEQFAFREENGGLTVIAYTGTEPVVCVPAEHNALPVTAITAGAFTEKELARLSLPISVECIEPGAFTRCVIRSISFFDTITNFPDAAFSDTSYPAVHLLAAQPPRYAGSGRASNYADKIDLLYQHRNDRKIVVFGGSGTYYSVLAGAMQQSLSDEYVVLNMGINGWFPAIPQLDVIRTWMRPGDILLHIPEMASGTQLFSDIRFALPVDDSNVFDDRYLRSLELNYDLIADMNELTVRIQ